jgi:nicotinamide phosphoribosyltransferase
MKQNPLLMTDGYKTSHHKMYPEGTKLVYSNFTPRNVKYMPDLAKDIVVFGIQYTLKYIHDLYNENFFNVPKDEVVGEAKSYLSSYLCTDYDVSHFEALHDLGYLPIKVKALREGSIVGEKIPVMTIYNTHPDFYWLPNFLETLISSLLWKPMHSASIANGYKKLLVKHANETDKENIPFVDFQGHDFSFRGMQHPESAISSGMGFLTSFSGTDTIPALKAAKYYYSGESVGFSVPSSEHAVVTSYGKEDEIESFRRIMKQFPSGIVSMVSDSFDLWQVCTKFVTELKDQILARDGKLVIRPDSGDPVDILCGKPYNGLPGISNNEHKGVIELLWNVFGGTINEQGYKILDSHIGAIYGDSITLERADEICKRLKAKGFASTNVVLGVGSYSMGYATRDNQGGAVKATYVELDEEFFASQESLEPGIRTIGREIFKDPVTDDGTKKSATGLLHVAKNPSGEYFLIDKVDWGVEGVGELKNIYVDGEFFNQTSLEDIRTKLRNS